MKFFSKNKILSLLSATLCLQIFSEITIPIEKAYKQLCQQELGLNHPTLIASLEMDIEELKAHIYLQIQEQIDKSLPYDEIKLPQIFKPNIRLSLPYKAEHVTSISTKTGGYVFWR